MGRQQLSTELKEFIREQIHSVVMLEILLLLHSNRPRSFSIVEIAVELGIEDVIAQEQLCALVRVELIARSADYEPLYWYYPLDTEHTTVVNELALAYSRQRVPILSLILRKRSDPIRLFAEAFRIVNRND